MSMWFSEYVQTCDVPVVGVNYNWVCFTYS